MNTNEDNILEEIRNLSVSERRKISYEELKEMLPKIGKNKLYKLLKDKEIYSKRIGKEYYIPKISVIEYLIKN